MRLTKLYLHNIGPFQDGEMELLAEEQIEALKKGWNKRARPANVKPKPSFLDLK